MRDPSGYVDTSGTEVLRHVNGKLPSNHFLDGGLATQLVNEFKLIPFSIELGRKKITSPKIAFVTFPYEWCNEQLLDASLLTLQIQELLLADSYELKDASAWNVIFDGVRPIFCDHLSFQKIEGRKWWAFAQFVRHFVFPLMLARYRSFDIRDSFLLWRDGVSPERAKCLMGWRRFVTKFWPLMMAGRRSTVYAPKIEAASVTDITLHRNLCSLLRWLLKSLNHREIDSTWGNYIEARPHYSVAASQFKAKVVERWLGTPSCVVDLGCNTGEYSEIALRAGAEVIAIDLDHEAIQKLYRRFKSAHEKIYPVVANLDDLVGGRGWAGCEFPGLIQRLSGKADVLMMLALIHHLAISSSIPYLEIACLANQITNGFLIVELLESNDPLVGMLAMQRARSTSEFSIEVQKLAFIEYFDLLEEQPVPGTNRVLCFMKKRDLSSRCPQ